MKLKTKFATGNWLLASNQLPAASSQQLTQIKPFRDFSVKIKTS